MAWAFGVAVLEVECAKAGRTDPMWTNVATSATRVPQRGATRLTRFGSLMFRPAPTREPPST